MKLKRILLVIFCLATIFAFAGCNEGSTSVEGMKVTFELEGGKFKNSPYAVVYTYDINEDEETYIFAPESFDPKKNPVTREGYELVGWFKTKSESGVYSDQFDFATEKVGFSGITLYAKWRKLIQFSYTVGYMENDQFVEIDKYTDVSENSRKFEDYLSYANKRTGYTPIKKYDEQTKRWVVEYFDVDGNPWDFTTQHPLDDNSPDVKVVVKYVKGKGVEFVRTKAELVSAKNKAIYLLNDIDMGGDVLTFGSYGEYKDKYFYGNGHKITNFKIQSDPQSLYENMISGDNSSDAIYVSIFGYLNKSVVKDVTFENVTYVLTTADEFKTHNFFAKTLYFAPITVKAEESTIENVTITNATVTYKQQNFYNNFDIESSLFIESQNAYYDKDDKSTITNCTINVTVINEDDN